jgi:hypothetical protein
MYYRKYHERTRGRDPLAGIQNRNPEVDNNVSLISPLWIEPLDHKIITALKLSLFSLPFILFILSIIINAQTWFTLNDDIGNDHPFQAAISLNEGIYTVLYAFSTIVFIYCIIHIMNDLKNYEDHLIC